VDGRAASIVAIVLGIVCAFLWIGTVLYYSSIILKRKEKFADIFF